MSQRSRRRIPAVVAVLLFMVATHPVAHAQIASAPVRATPSIGVDAVVTVGMTVSDLDRAIDFYTDVLSFRVTDRREVLGDAWERLQGVFGLRLRMARLVLGDETIELTEYMTPRGRPIPVDSRSNDKWFQHIAIVVRDMDSAYARLRAHDVEHASTAPQRLPDWNPNAGGIEAFYFKDPDGHVLEIISFPPGKGDPRWQEARGELFLGVDHTAIVVTDTERSFAFYRDALGLALAGESLNFGVEQEHLNAVFGARVRITALRAPSGPAVEFLEYLSPADGRPYPWDARPNDLLHWETTLRVDDLDAVVARLSFDDVRFITASPVELPAGVGFSRALLVRDPDGHAIRLIET